MFGGWHGFGPQEASIFCLVAKLSFERMGKLMTTSCACGVLRQVIQWLSRWDTGVPFTRLFFPQMVSEPFHLMRRMYY